MEKIKPIFISKSNDFLWYTCLEPFNILYPAIAASTNADVIYAVTSTCATFVGMAGLNIAKKG